jgi:AAA domain
LPDSLKDVEAEVQSFKPQLVIIDSVRGLDSKAETENQSAGELLKNLHKMAAAHETSFVFVHHLKKPDRKNPPGKLAETQIMQWLEQVSGARALVNQSDVRIGCERGNDEDMLIMKGHYKLVGEFGPYQIERVLDENGDPLGYKMRVGIALLSADDRAKFALLPAGQFTFTQAEEVYDKKKAGRPTAKFLKLCVDACLLSKSGSGKQGRYEKKSEATGAPEGQKTIK